ncbi:MAG TPA: Crp/Fnr family transcriptional regulator [Baekduia sp.]|uniref:Crp/Fnr family transcriptional regulator n=1 Tax=Baekduia sp. TaxID=2600305 RepID=UPI002D767956|nr:Crp/Fnr family transcriptional regulator [Baekduia sp.]HET6509017.1 Crp/Fnr family transcriptional regulator [Baekduia sp.]
MDTVVGSQGSNALDGFPPMVVDAWEDSFLARLPQASVARLVDGARVARLDAGEIFYRGAFHEETATLALVVDGLVRMYMKSADGRQVTLHYASPGSMIGLPACLLAVGEASGGGALERFRMLGGEALDGEAIRDSVILRLRPACWRTAVQQDPAVAATLAVHLAERLSQAHKTLAADLFLPVRSRVAGHLLNLAERDGHALIVRSNHQSIAASIGSVREVVSRTLKRMENDGLVERIDGAYGCLRLIDPAALHRLASNADDGALHAA